MMYVFPVLEKPEGFKAALKWRICNWLLPKKVYLTNQHRVLLEQRCAQQEQKAEAFQTLMDSDDLKEMQISFQHPDYTPRRTAMMTTDIATGRVLEALLTKVCAYGRKRRIGGKLERREVTLDPPVKGRHTDVQRHYVGGKMVRRKRSPIYWLLNRLRQWNSPEARFPIQKVVRSCRIETTAIRSVDATTGDVISQNMHVNWVPDLRTIEAKNTPSPSSLRQRIKAMLGE